MPSLTSLSGISRIAKFFTLALDPSHSYSARRAVLALNRPERFDDEDEYEYHFSEYEYDRSMINVGNVKGLGPCCRLGPTHASIYFGFSGR